MKDKERGGNIRPREEDFDIEQTWKEDLQGKDGSEHHYRERIWVISVILVSCVLLAGLMILVYSLLKNGSRRVIIPTQDMATEVTMPDVSTQEETSSVPESSGIPEKTKDTSEASSEELPEYTQDTAETPPAETQEESAATYETVTEIPAETEPVTTAEIETTPVETEVTWQDVDQDGIRYRVTEGKASVVACWADWPVITPLSDIFGYPVVGIDDHAFMGLQTVTQIIVPEGVDWISEDAFNDCPNLQRVVIPDTVSGINVNAFGNSAGHVVIEAHEASFAHNYAVNAGMAWEPRSNE